MQVAINSLISTLIVILIFPVIGFIIDKIVYIIIKNIYKLFGKFITNLIANWLTFIGTVHHEMAHAIMLFITGAKIIKIDFFHPSGATLGKVSFQTRGNKILKSIQLTLGSIAPVIAGLTSIYFLIYRVLAICSETWQIVLTLYLIVSILLHTTMSKQDIKNALSGLPVCSIIIFLIFLFTKFNLISLFM